MYYIQKISKSSKLYQSKSIAKGVLSPPPTTVHCISVKYLGCFSVKCIFGRLFGDLQKYQLSRSKRKPRRKWAKEDFHFFFFFFSLLLSHFPVFKRGGHVEVFCIYLSHLLDLWQNSHKRIGFQIHWLDNFHLQMCPVLRIMKMTVSVSFCSKFIAQIKLWKCWF